jgi:hypothetical protein
MHRLRCLVVIGASAVVVGVVAAGPAVAANGGNNDTAQACQHGGWHNLTSVAGGAFANQGDCVNDGPQFGTAGKAACADLKGTFNTHPPNGSGQGWAWTCSWNLSTGSGSTLNEACDTDLGLQAMYEQFNAGATGSAICQEHVI